MDNYKITRERKSTLKEMIQELVPQITEFRHELHRQPELGFQEYETARRIREQLARTKAEVLPPYLETDTVALLYGEGKASEGSEGTERQTHGRNITLRADIDALALTDRCGKPWQSDNSGKAHSCGHDGHTAILLGTALVLSNMTNSFSGSVRFVFQPAEEQLGGGKALVEAGVLEADPKADAVFALHSWPELPVGTFAAKSGLSMAASDGFSITVKGKGGHGAKPHLAVNPIIPAAHIVHMIEEAVTQSIDPLLPVVISICQIHSGQANNVIPEEAVLSGTIRYYEPGLKDIIDKRLGEIARGCCLAAGADCEYTYRKGYIPLVNDKGQTEFVRSTLLKWLGAEAWDDSLGKTTSSEDFSFYLDKVPGTFIRIGTGNPEINLHNPEFDFNDSAIESGILALCALALEYLGIESE